ncbi:MAG TPA: ornithine cyclodeaminase family protein [Solirubrobacteraceae bacterium]|jgi:ornithine cyclodeaminase/alanine dehydrogenase-like protein (mu-crystallin family)
MLLLREDDVRALLSMEDTLGAVEDAFLRQVDGTVRYRPRERLRMPSGTLNVLPAADLSLGVGGLKTYIALRGAARFVVLLFDLESSDLLAMVEADYLGMMRTGAASGVASKHLAAAKERHTLAVIGCGWQARGQIEAVAASCPVGEVRVFSRTGEQREEFALKIEEELSLPCIAATSAAEATAGATVICTATNAATPVLAAADVAPGTHINAAGSNSLLRRELPDELVRRAQTIVVDSRAQAEGECGDLLAALQSGWLDLQSLPELGEVLVGRCAARTADSDVTIFESQGLGSQDVAVAAHLYRLAQDVGAGEDIAFASGSVPH